MRHRTQTLYVLLKKLFFVKFYKFVHLIDTYYLYLYPLLFYHNGNVPSTGIPHFHAKFMLLMPQRNQHPVKSYGRVETYYVTSPPAIFRFHCLFVPESRNSDIDTFPDSPFSPSHSEQYTFCCGGGFGGAGGFCAVAHHPSHIISSRIREAHNGIVMAVMQYIMRESCLKAQNHCMRTIIGLFLGLALLSN